MMATACVVTIRLTPEQYEWVVTTAKMVDRPMSWVLRDLIEQAKAAEG